MGTCVWNPPPATADTCIEKLRKARMKRKASFYIIVLAKLFTPLWLKYLNKVTDFHFLISPNHPFWGPHYYENLIIVFMFPFIPFRRWQLRGGGANLFAIDRQLCKVFREERLDTGNILP